MIDSDSEMESEDDIKTLYNTIRNSERVELNIVEDKYFINFCCITEKWCFTHIGISAFKQYDKNINNCCTCLDYCSWCLEFHTNKYICCKKQTNCYICCCTIYFT